MSLGSKRRLSRDLAATAAHGVEKQLDFFITSYYTDRRRHVGKDFNDGKRIMFIEDVEVVRLSEGALLLSQKNKSGDIEFWCPKSQLDEDSEITEESEVGDSGTLAIPKWLADKCDLTYVD
jgi:hypothetical protein